ncbi:hypothetical protein RHO14_08260 [Orbus wheelerorum]|uniref:hypothetical protein n=1 Tax=Orbus wheelerorum TaxID=3074111 RepID=UPI00370D28FF
MKKITYSLAISLLLSSFVASADGPLIIKEDNKIIRSINDTLYYTGAADAQLYQSLVYNSGSNAHYLCNATATDFSYDLGRIEMIPRVTYSNMSFSSGVGWGMLYLFETNIPAYKIAPWYSTSNFNGGENMPSTGIKQASIYYQTTTVWQGNMPDAQRKMTNNTSTTGGVRVDHGFYIYKGTDRVPAGDEKLYPVPNETLLMDYNCRDTKDHIREINHIIMTPLNTNRVVTSCVPDKKTDIVKMEPISLADLEAAKTSGSTVGTVSQGFSLKCDPNVQVWLSLVDLTDQTNVSYISKLTADSTAKGVGYSVSFSSKKLRFGPDISAAFPSGDTTVDRALIKTTSAYGSSIPLIYSLNFSYAPTGEEISKGTANSLIGITYSYQ